jgi:hypothetical protein
MKQLSRAFSALAAACAALCLAGPAHAQTTDGYHSILVFPVVVDTAAFTQRFSFGNPSNAAISVNVKYFPAEDTSQATPLDCGNVAIPAGQVHTFTSLRQMCAGLASGSQFGFVYMRETESRGAPFTAYSRVSNPQGNGFSVEAFPASTFGALEARSIGVRRLAASGGNPAFQTNCFVGAINNVNAGATPSFTTWVDVYAGTGGKIGATMVVPVTPGKLTRILDVFAFVGAPAGDYDNAQVRFSHDASDMAGLLNFCTVQDNTSYGADFRIAKQEHPFDYELVGPQDDHAVRSGIESQDAFGRVFELGTGAAAANTHLVYFKHPDWIECRLLDPLLDTPPTNSYGVEMRLVEADTGAVLAGGAGIQGFTQIYTGDKTDRNNGANTRYFLQVESNGLNTGSTRPYRVQCGSGSGHTRVDLVAYKEALNRF